MSMEISNIPSFGYSPSPGFNLPTIPSIPIAILTIILSSIPTVSADEEAFANCVQECKEDGGSAWKCGLFCLPTLLIGLRF